LNTRFAWIAMKAAARAALNRMKLNNALRRARERVENAGQMT
jgi:hypothetical protein